MTIYDLTLCPTNAAISLQANTGLYPSPLTASAQTLDRGGFKWKIVYTFENLTLDERGELMGLIAALRGQANRIRVRVFDNPARGAYGGTPLVAGAGQTGGTLNIDGVTSIANWIRAGDYFSVVVNGEHELKMATADVTSAAGAATLTFEPRLRAAPADNAVIYVHPINSPRGVFLLESPETGWASRPWIDRAMSTFTLSMVEDLFATQ